MLNAEYDFTLYEYFSNKLEVCSLTSDQSETNIRCPFCGDSIKDRRHAHLYINNKPPFKYYCQRCNISGIVDNNFLRDINLYDPDMISYVNKSKNKYINDLNRKYGNNFLGYLNRDVNILPNEYGKLELKKIKYIEKRLGIKIKDDTDVEKFKIILNLENFFDNNKIKKNSFFEKGFTNLQNNHVSFLMNDKNVVCMRNIKERLNKGENRYYNKKLYQDSPIQSRKFYTIGNDLDLSKDIFNIYMAEGVFDILGVFHHVYNCEMNSNDIFIACNGKSYNFALNYLKTLGILNCNINIFSDKDVERSKFEYLCKYNILCKFNGINLYYNTIGKDYGVTKDQIKLSKVIEL